MNINLATDLANCTDPDSFKSIMKDNGIFIPKGILGFPEIKKLNQRNSNVKFEYHNGEDKAFTILVCNKCL